MAEDGGFESLFRSDHLTGLFGDARRSSLDTWASLTWLATATARIRFGPLVSPLTFYHPALLAKRAAAVAELAAGRLDLGIGAGSLLCERLSGRKVEIGLVPFGSLGLTLFGIDLWLGASAGSLGRTAIDLFVIGVFGGFYIVPLYALVQSRSEKSHRSRVIAGNNILNAAFIVAAPKPAARAGCCRSSQVARLSTEFASNSSAFGSAPKSCSSAAMTSSAMTDSRP